MLYEKQAFAIGGSPMPFGEMKNVSPVRPEDIEVVEHLNETIDLSLVFTNEEGKSVPLSTYFQKGKPVHLLLLYYNCPTLCSTYLNQLFESFNTFEWTLGDKYEFVAVSIDPKETPKDAKNKKMAFLESYGRKDKSPEKGVHFLTGEEENIKKLASQVGFGYKKISLSEEWAHSSVSFILTPEGKISFYHYGLTLNPETYRLSLVEASQYKIGTIMDRVVLYCLRYDPNKKSYAAYAFNILRLVGTLFALVLGFFMLRFWIGQRKRI